MEKCAEEKDEWKQLRHLSGFEERELKEAIANPSLDMLIKVAKAIRPRVEEEYITISMVNDIWATNDFYGRVELWIGEPLTDCRFGTRGFTAERKGDLLFPVYRQEKLVLNSAFQPIMEREFPEISLREIKDSYTEFWSHHIVPERHYGNLYPIKIME